MCGTHGLGCVAVKDWCALDLITDPDMYLMVASGMRGGVCTISQRYAKANNPYLGADYDPNSPSKYIIDLYASNLYGWAMSQYLPSGHFDWLDEAGWAQKLASDLPNRPIRLHCGMRLGVPRRTP